MSCCDSVLNSSVQSNAVTEDCIIAYKIFDQCRKQICLTPCILGPARSSRLRRKKKTLSEQDTGMWKQSLYFATHLRSAIPTVTL